MHIVSVPAKWVQKDGLQKGGNPYFMSTCISLQISGSLAGTTLFFHFKNTYLTVPRGHVTFQYSMFSLERPAEYPVNGVTTSPSVHD